MVTLYRMCSKTPGAPSRGSNGSTLQLDLRLTLQKQVSLVPLYGAPQRSNNMPQLQLQQQRMVQVLVSHPGEQQ